MCQLRKEKNYALWEIPVGNIKPCSFNTVENRPCLLIIIVYFPEN